MKPRKFLSNIVRQDVLYFFLFVIPPVWQLAFNIYRTFFPFSLSSLSYPLSLPPLPSPPPEPPSFLTARVTPHENVTAAILSYAVSHLHEGTGKLRKTCADTVGHLTESVPSLPVSEKMTSRSAFRCAGRGPAVTHPSTDPAERCLTWVIAWHRTPTTHRTLSVSGRFIHLLATTRALRARYVVSFWLMNKSMNKVYSSGH